MFDVMIITYNEALNLPHCLAAIAKPANKVYVVDSGSTDETAEIAQSYGAEVVHHDWAGYAGQKNWGLENLTFESPWILLLDADEVVTTKLLRKITDLVNRPVNEVRENGFFLNRLSYFMDQPIHHCGFFPSWNLRLFKQGAGRFENREVHEHVVIDDPLGYIEEPMLHQDRRGLEHYFAKHNRYSTLEARELYRDIVAERQRDEDSANLTPTTRRRRWLKRSLYHRMPLPGLIRFLYMYIFRLGVLDGQAGFDFCRFIANYDSMLAMKLRRSLRARNQSGGSKDSNVEIDSTVALSQREGVEPASPRSSEPAFNLSTKSLSQTDSNLHSLTKTNAGDTEGLHSQIQVQPEPSSWSLRDKTRRAIWMLIGRPLFRFSFHNWYPLRAWLLRRFGAYIGQRTAIRPSVNIEIPWHLRIDDDATIGDHAILYSLGHIHIGPRAIVSQYAHLCAGTHDHTDRRFPLICAPITIRRDAWIGADVFVGPGVDIGELAVVGARSNVFKDLPPDQVCFGSPARPVKPRNLR